MFRFVVKYLGFLKHVPVLPHVFEACLKISTVFSNRLVLDYIDEIENEVLSWERTSVDFHKFGGIQFNCNNKEIGHIHGNGLLDVLFSREIKMRLLTEGQVTDHHVFTNSGWISFMIRNQHDKIVALRLLKESYEMKAS